MSDERIKSVREMLGRIEVRPTDFDLSGRNIDPPAQAVLAVASYYRSNWQTCDNSYWLARLMQEVGELSSSLVGDHRDPPEHELLQVASIALNWLRLLRYQENERIHLERMKVMPPGFDPGPVPL